MTTTKFSTLYHTNRVNRTLVGLRCRHNGVRLAFLRSGTKVHVRLLDEETTGWAGEAICTLIRVGEGAQAMRKAVQGYLTSK